MPCAIFIYEFRSITKHVIFNWQFKYTHQIIAKDKKNYSEHRFLGFQEFYSGWAIIASMHVQTPLHAGMPLSFQYPPLSPFLPHYPPLSTFLPHYPPLSPFLPHYPPLSPTIPHSPLYPFFHKKGSK